ncbi:hypothetical protein ABZW67_06190 [Streptomyces rubiginosohelvolus]|uniref:hypothetical protein n=1 Tax=Streptomyces rubiginosohelvolus TaxID=67362 RepID=UPI0033BE73E2
MSLRVDAIGNVVVGGAPTQEYTVVWRAAATGEVATETRKEKLSTLRNYVFRTCLDYNFTGANSDTVLEAEIWRTYKKQSKRVR